ncbi:MAG: redoxin domain-containing protein [Pirellulales bacterium]|nr:redoxin domain-containing protein [Pirellulales bacterium]
MKRDRVVVLIASLAALAIANQSGSASAAELAASSQSKTADCLGRQIESFALPDFHGKARSLADFAEQKLVVVAFLGTECPLAKVYASRLVGLSKEFKSQGVAFVAIDSNLQDSMTEIGTFARIYELDFPILKDLDNRVADQFGAVRTPEVFVLDAERRIRYWGRVDDQYGFQTGAGYAKPRLQRRDLAVAIEELLAGKPVSEPVKPADGCLIGRVNKTAPQGEVTYTKHIASILQNRCAECHRPGEVAPFSLLAYDEVVGWAPMMKEVVSEGRMPPWFADPAFGHFANDARLSDEEKQLLYTWIDNGCPEGDPSDLPPPRQFVEGWRIGQPDQVIHMADEPFTVPAEGVVDYQYFTVDPGWKEDKWIKVSEARPDNRGVVHHIIAFVQPPNSSSGAFGRRGGLAGYAPGSLPIAAPEGAATFVPAGSKLVFQMHYTPNGVESKDRSSIGVIFADPKTIHRKMKGGVAGNVRLKIPAGDSNYEVTAKHKFTRDTVLLNLTPHMHLRGKDFKYELEYPDGTREVLLNVPRWDFNWQLRYEFAEPKLVPKGSRILCTAHFDNSADNLANPDPASDVTFGDQTWEEMMFGFYTAYDPHEDLLATNASAGPEVEATVDGFAGEGSVTADDAAAEKKTEAGGDKP